MSNDKPSKVELWDDAPSEVQRWQAVQRGRGYFVRKGTDGEEYGTVNIALELNERDDYIATLRTELAAEMNLHLKAAAERDEAVIRKDAANHISSDLRLSLREERTSNAELRTERDKWKAKAEEFIQACKEFEDDEEDMRAENERLRADAERLDYLLDGRCWATKREDIDNAMTEDALK